MVAVPAAEHVAGLVVTKGVAGVGSWADIENEVDGAELQLPADAVTV